MLHASPPQPAQSSRRLRLKAACQALHDALDQRIMAFNPFQSTAHYAAFLQSQYALHRDVQALYADATLNQWLPQLRQRCRLALVQQDLQDLGLAPIATTDHAPAFEAHSTPPPVHALGWLYTVEGSNIGAAFLRKLAASLGMHAQHGARHLAPHPDGRAAHWRDFTEQLDGLTLAEEDEAAVIAGGQAAFARATQHVQRYCAL